MKVMIKGIRKIKALKIVVLVMSVFMSLLFNNILAGNNFVFNGKPIKPTCIALLSSMKPRKSEKSGKLARSIDVGRCVASESAYQATHQDQRGRYYFYVNNENSLEGAFYYKVIGQAKNGIYVLHAYKTGGGAGVYGQLLFVRLSQQKNTMNARPALVATLVGTVQGGDRCAGGIESVKIKGNHLMVKQYSLDNLAYDCQSAKQYTINLATRNSFLTY